MHLCSEVEVQFVSSFFSTLFSSRLCRVREATNSVLEMVMFLVVNWVSALANHSCGSLGQNGDSLSPVLQ